MSLTLRKIIVIVLIGAIFLAGNILLVANWLAEQGIQEKARWLRQEFLTGTALCVIIALLILLTGPSKRKIGISRNCPVCSKKLLGNPNYCAECGSKVA